MQPSDFPPGTGVFRPDRDKRFDAPDHMHNWNMAIQNALENFGRAPGRYAANVTLTATVDVKNPGSVIEYIASFS
jgi:hypothetical protein